MRTFTRCIVGSDHNLISATSALQTIWKRNNVLNKRNKKDAEVYNVYILDEESLQLPIAKQINIIY